MKKYTEKIHAERLLKMLNRKNPCGHCPAAKRYNSNDGPEALWSLSVDPCKICSDFLGLESLEDPDLWTENSNCPCNRLDPEEAIALTRKALKKKGYLK